jgi:histidine ammonia-lyase
MGANAATKLFRVVENVYTILAIELLTSAQAMQFRRPLKTSPLLEDWLSNFREKVTFLQDDRLLHNDIIKSIAFLKNSKLPEL